MDRRVSILREVETGRNELNEPIIEWKKIATVWAQQRPERGSERFAANQVQGKSVLVFHIRFRADLSERDRLLYNREVYDIVAPPRELGRGVVSEIDASARTDDGAGQDR